MGLFEADFLMSLLPHRTSYQQQSAAAKLAELKKGDKEKRSEFIWVYQEKFYAIAYIATGSVDSSTDLAIFAFQQAFAALNQVNLKQLSVTIWEWLSTFIVNACTDWHAAHSAPIDTHPRTDPASDGSAQMDWETTIILGAQRVKRCVNALPAEQQKVFLLRHHFQLTYEQIAGVVNQSPHDVMSWLFRARVQIVKCLGRG